MQQFNLEEWLKDKSRKICTRDGRIVEILKVDAKGNHPIIGIYQFSDTEDMESSWRIDGKKAENEVSILDLFFADEEKCNKIINELKSYLKSTPKEQVEKDWKEIQDWYAQHFTNEKHNEEEELTEFDYAVLSIISDHNSHTDSIESFAKRSSKKLLDLARKEIEDEANESLFRMFGDRRRYADNDPRLGLQSLYNDLKNFDMTQEEKELLLKDLCGRLLYGVFVEYDYGDGVKRATEFHGNYLYLMMIGKLQWKDFKPYLRPMSSMTKEEKKEVFACVSSKGWAVSAYQEIDWLNAHHFDYRGLIERGLVLEAPEGMYK